MDLYSQHVSWLGKILSYIFYCILIKHFYNVYNIFFKYLYIYVFTFPTIFQYVIANRATIYNSCGHHSLCHFSEKKYTKDYIAKKR